MDRSLFAVALLALLCGCAAAAAVGPPRPLILVPGLMGTILQKHTFESGRTQQIFPLLVEQTSHLQDLYCACGLYEDDAGALTDEDDDHTCRSPAPEEFEVVVPLDNAGLYAIDLLMPNELLEPNRKPYFHNMIAMLEEEHGYVAGETLFGFPYDWRQPTSHVAELLAARVEEVLDITGASQVDIVSHSLGCLVTQAYFSLPVERESASERVREHVTEDGTKDGTEDVTGYDTERKNDLSNIVRSLNNSENTVESEERDTAIGTHPLVHTHIAAGGPYGGIGGGWTILTLWGFQYDQVMIMPWNLHQLLIQFPSTYDFIARSITYIEEWDSEAEGYRGEPVPTFSFERDGETVTLAAGGGECLDVVRAALMENSVTLNDGHSSPCPLPFRDDLLENALATMEEIEANITPPEVFHIIYGVVGDSGWSVHFPRDVTAEDDYSILLGKPTTWLGTPPFLFDLTACVRGDGVVPQVSTTLSHMEADSTSYFQVQHGLLVTTELDSYEHLLGISCPWSGFWRVELLTVNGIEFVESQGVGVVDFCPDREPSQGQWLCEGELCGHYDANADVAVVTIKLQQSGWRVTSLQDELSGIDSSTIASLEGRVWKDRLVATATLQSGERMQFFATQSRDCENLTGYYRYDWDVETEFAFTATKRDSATVAGQCVEGTTRSCTGPNEAGIERCSDGFWSSCTACVDGYRFVDGFPYDPSYCERTSEPLASPSPAPSPSSTPPAVSSAWPSPSLSSNSSAIHSSAVESPEGSSNVYSSNIAIIVGICLVVFAVAGLAAYGGYRYRWKLKALISGQAVEEEDGEGEMQELDVDNSESV